MTSIEQRFWSHVDKNGDCWVWTGAAQSSGYGQFAVTSGHPVLAHRFSYEIVNGPISDGAWIDHICRNRLCVRPSHLRSGTPKQNCENRDARGCGKSGVRGVRWDKSRAKWSAAIGHNGKTINLGRFDTVPEAAEAARRARLELFTFNNSDRGMK